MIGVVLTGGKSERFGTDKAFVELDGKFLYQRQAELLSEFCDKLFISCNNSQESMLNGYDLIIDELEAQGPLQGLVQVFQQHESDCMVLACDLPQIQSTDLDQVRRQSEGYDLTIALSKSGREQPLCSIWKTKAMKAAITYYQSGGRKMMTLLNQPSIQVGKVELADDALLNLNFSEDLNKLKG